jgi:hypothetical protein
LLLLMMMMMMMMMIGLCPVLNVPDLYSRACLTWGACLSR